MRRLLGLCTALALVVLVVLPAGAHHRPNHGGGGGGGGGTTTTTTTTLPSTTTTQATTTTTAAPPEGVVFQDNFSDTSKWEWWPVGTASFEAVNGEGVLTVSNEEISKARIRAIMPDISYTDLYFTIRSSRTWTGSFAPSINVGIDGDHLWMGGGTEWSCGDAGGLHDHAQHGYSLRWKAFASAQAFVDEYHCSEGDTQTNWIPGFGFPAGTSDLRVRFQAEGTTLRVKWWDPSDPEPGTWNQVGEDTDGSSLRSGVVHFSLDGSTILSGTDSLYISDVVVFGSPPPVDPYEWGANPAVYYDIDEDPATYEGAVESSTCTFNNILSEPGLEISGVPYFGLTDMSELGDPVDMHPVTGDLDRVPSGAIWVTARDLGSNGPLAQMTKDVFGEVVHGLIVFNINPGVDWDVSSGGQLAPCGTSHVIPDGLYDLQGIITHELGHVVAGIDDLCSDPAECSGNKTFYPPAVCAGPGASDTQAGYTMCSPWWESDGNDTASRRYFSAEEQQWILDKYTP